MATSQYMKDKVLLWIHIIGITIVLGNTIFDLGMVTIGTIGYIIAKYF